MSAADKIGLLPGFDWVAGHSAIVALFICWALTPLGMIAIGLIGESRLIPLRSDKQYLSFFPGDLCLGVMAAGLLTLAQGLPSQQRWYNGTLWHGIVLGAAAVVAIAMTVGEWRAKVYPLRALLSPTKLYHNGLLYIGYGYVIVTTLVAVVVGLPWSELARYWLVPVWFAASLAFGLIWAGLVWKDNSLGGEAMRAKAKYAHIATWEPFWRLP